MNTTSDHPAREFNGVRPKLDDTWWEEAARTAWGVYMTEVEERALLEASALAGQPGTALEIGCEGGRWSMLLQRQGWDNTCTDIAPAAIATCQRRLPAARCLVVLPTDTSLPVADGSIGLLVVHEVPPVVEASWFPAEARRVLRPDGVLVFTYLNSHSYRALAYRVVRIARRLLRRDEVRVFYQGPSYRSLRRRLVRLGFEMVREEGFCWFPFGRRSNSQWIAPAVRMESLLGLRRVVSISPWVAAIAQLRRA